MSTCGLTASQFTNADTNNIKIDELNQNGALILQVSTYNYNFYEIIMEKNVHISII